jgi:hypothetical protein
MHKVYTSFHHILSQNCSDIVHKVGFETATAGDSEKFYLLRCNAVQSAYCLLNAGLLRGLLVDPEDGAAMVHRIFD